jgi:6-phosphogluconolactonase
MKTKYYFFNKSKENTFEKFSSNFLFQKLKKIENEISGKLNIALSGGNTPLPILEILQNEDLTWSRYNFFLVDERCVPNENPLSNFGNIRKVFFNQISSQSFPIIQDGISHKESVVVYVNEILKQVPLNENNIPVFDLILLGMGDDGHTASLFPNTKALLEENKFFVFNEIPQMQTERITITYPVLLNSKEIIVIVKGQNKKKIIKELYYEKPSEYPILKLTNSHSNLKWLIG